MISFRFTSIFLAFWYVAHHSSFISHMTKYICEREKNIYEKSMIAIIIGMWTRFIHWQNKLTIDYFRNVDVMYHPFASIHSNKSYRSIFPHRKMKIIHMEITSYIYSKHFSHEIRSLFRWIKKDEEKKIGERKMIFDQRHMLIYDQNIRWFVDLGFHAHSFTHHIHQIFFIGKWQYSHEPKAILLWVMASHLLSQVSHVCKYLKRWNLKSNQNKLSAFLINDAICGQRTYQWSSVYLVFMGTTLILALN